MCFIFVVIKLIKYVLITIGKHILHITYDYKSTIRKLNLNKHFVLFFYNINTQCTHGIP